MARDTTILATLAQNVAFHAHNVAEDPSSEAEQRKLNYALKRLDDHRRDAPLPWLGRDQRTTSDEETQAGELARCHDRRALLADARARIEAEREAEAAGVNVSPGEKSAD